MQSYSSPSITQTSSCSPRATKKGGGGKQERRSTHKLAFGQAGMGETISAEGGQYPLADYVRGGHNPLADYVRGDKICRGTKSAPTPAE